MITALTSYGEIEIDGLCEQRQYLTNCNLYVIGIGMGFDTSFFLAGGFSEQDALDSFIDSKYGHLVIVDDEDDIKEYEKMGILSYCGNAGEPCQLDELRVLEQTNKVNWFAKK